MDLPTETGTVGLGRVDVLGGRLGRRLGRIVIHTTSGGTASSAARAWGGCALRHSVELESHERYVFILIIFVFLINYY